MEDDTEGTQQPHLLLANKLFLLKHSAVDDIEKVRLRDEVMSAVVADDMAPLYETLTASSVLELDQKVLDSMRGKIEEELKKLDAKIGDADLGETEVRDAHLAKFLFYIRISDKEKALEQLKLTEGKTVAVGQRMDLVFYTLQIGFFHMDFDLIARSIGKAKNLFEEGVDLERKNRLKVYKGLYCISTRNFKKAADLFLDSISTFTAYELVPYDTFIFYTVLASIISLDRVSLKQKVVDAPEILTVIGKIPYLSEFLNSFYECQYKSFFTAFAGIMECIKLDRYLYPHLRYYMREIRTVVYSQFLESYKSVTIEAMAKAFGLAVDFTDINMDCNHPEFEANCYSSGTGSSNSVSNVPDPTSPEHFPMFGATDGPNMVQPTFQPSQSLMPSPHFIQQQWQQFMQWQQTQFSQQTNPQREIEPEPQGARDPEPQPQPEGSSRRGRRHSKKNTGWTKDEESLLATLWIEVSEDSSAGKSQIVDSFWYKIMDRFNNSSPTERTKDQLSSKWRDMNNKVHKFNNIYINLDQNRESGESDVDVLTTALDMYRATHGNAFTLHHCWQILSGHPKWKNPNPCVVGRRNKKSRDSSEVTPGPTMNVDDNVDLFEDEEIKRPSGKPRKTRGPEGSSSGTSSAADTVTKLAILDKVEEYKNLKKEREEHKMQLKEKKNDMKILALPEVGLSQSSLDALLKAKAAIREKYNL